MSVWSSIHVILTCVGIEFLSVSIEGHSVFLTVNLLTAFNDHWCSSISLYLKYGQCGQNILKETGGGHQTTVNFPAYVSPLLTHSADTGALTMSKH